MNPMLLNQESAEIYYPNPQDQDLTKTTYLGIGAHQDDLEILAIYGILQAYTHAEHHFTGVTVTDGRGSPRTGAFSGLSDHKMAQIRNQEQKKAADLGHYQAQFLLNYRSETVKSPEREQVVKDLIKIIQSTAPKVILTHNPADRHDTHVTVCLAVIEALRQTPITSTLRCYGCEVWRGLDWLPVDQKIALDVSQNQTLQKKLLKVFDSQITGGKAYARAAMSRRLANATFHQSHKTDQTQGLVYAIDLMPLVKTPQRKISDYMDETIQKLNRDVRNRLERLGEP